MSYSNIKSEAFGKYCRECINKMYKKNLKPKNCVYLPYPVECHKCGKVKNIVIDVTKSGRFKLIF